jgi:Putative peptidoglycan binding domain
LPRGRRIDPVASIHQAGEETSKQFVAVATNGCANDTGHVAKPLSAKSAKRELTQRQHAILPCNALRVTRATTTAVDLIRITAITRVGRIRTGATAHPWGYNPYSYWGGYPYSSYNNYSYYMPAYGYNASLVASVQRRLGQLGYYHGIVDGIAGPQTRGAIAAFEDRNGLVVDERISRPLLDTLRLG